MDIQKFFKDNPNAPFLWQAGDKYFLKHAEVQAKNHARVTGVKLVKIVNPALKKENNSTRTSKKEKLQAKANELGISFNPNTTVKELEKMISEKENNITNSKKSE